MDWPTWGDGKHLRVDHSQHEFERDRAHVDDIEGFWGYAKTRFVQVRGIHKRRFYFHLKEWEFRFYHRGQNLYQL